MRSYGLPGIRQTRWIVGREQLTVDDVRAGTKFPDAVARTAWPIELHDSPQGYVWEPFGDDHMHYVPFGSLVPAEADNIVAAGRCIDGDSRGALERAGDGAVHRDGRGRRARARSRRQRQRAADRPRGAQEARVGQCRADGLDRRHLRDL